MEAILENNNALIVQQELAVPLLPEDKNHLQDASALAPVFHEMEPDEDLVSKYWTPWRVRRRTTDAISIESVVALSFGIDPELLAELSDDTTPSLSGFNRRVKYIVELVDQDKIKIITGKLLGESKNEKQLIRFSQFVDFVIAHKLPVSPVLIEINSETRSDQPTISLEDPNSKTAVLDQPLSPRKTTTIETILGAMALFIMGQAKAQVPISKSFISGERLDYSGLANALETIINDELSNGETTAGVSHQTIRKHLSTAINRYPAKAMENILAHAKDKFRTGGTW